MLRREKNGKVWWKKKQKNRIFEESQIQADTIQTFLSLTNAALIPVNVAGAAHVSYGTVAVVHASDRVGVTLRARPTRVTDAGVVSVAEQS